MSADTNVAAMKATPERNASRSRLWSIASAAAALLLACWAAVLFMSLNVIWNPAYYGQFGLYVDGGSNIVTELVPNSPADRAGIKIGDIVEPPQTLHDRSVLDPFWSVAPRPGDRIMLSLVRGDKHRTLTLQARPLPPLDMTEKVKLVLKSIWFLVFVIVALVLVLLRPTMITWGFYLFALNLVAVFGPAEFHPPLTLWWLIVFNFSGYMIGPAGVAGFVVFCVRFPANTPTGWRKTIENLALCAFVILAVAYTYFVVTETLELTRFVAFSPVVDNLAVAILWIIVVVGAAVLLTACLSERLLERQRVRWIVFGSTGVLAAAAVADVILYGGGNGGTHPILAMFMLGTFTFLINYFDSRGLDRNRIKWVLFGLTCALAATVVDLAMGGTVLHPAPWIAVFELLYVVLPLTVAYAVVRHRVIDVRFVVGRSLALGAIASIVLLIVIAIDWLFSTRLPASRFQAAVYIGLVLLVGFSLNAAWRSISKIIDFVFFRPWYRARAQVEIVADAVRHAASNLDLHEPLISGVASALSLASAALFERLEDGGFFRVSALGWPPGTTWNILPDDQLTAQMSKSRRVVDVDAFGWQKRSLPSGIARPTIGLPIVTSKQVAAVLLYGAHENGTALDPDELRAIRKLCADACFIYREPQLESGRTTFLTEPLGA